MALALQTQRVAILLTRIVGLFLEFKVSRPIQFNVVAIVGLGHRYADLLDQNSDELSALETMDSGKPYEQARYVELPIMSRQFRYYAGWADKIVGQTMAMDGSFAAQTLHEPIGVVGQIIPWNFPLVMYSWKVAPALAAGRPLCPPFWLGSWPWRPASPLVSSTSSVGLVPLPEVPLRSTWTSTRSHSQVQFSLSTNFSLLLHCA
jgi:hypothetical protein